MKITQNIHALKHHFQIPVSPELKVDRFVYSYIVFGQAGVYLVDSGVAASAPAIADAIAQNGRSMADVRSLFLTHSHPDHIGAARLIQEKSGCKIYAHAGEKNWIEDVAQQVAERPVPGFDTLVAGSVRIDRLLADGETIELEKDLSLQVIYTPGHSDGSLAFLFQNDGVLVSGDCVLLPGQLPIYDDVARGIDSVRKLKRLPGLKVLLSAWDEPRSGADALLKLDQSIGYLEKIQQTIRGIENAAALDRMELCRRVVKSLGLPPDAFNPLVIRSLHLNARAV